MKVICAFLLGAVLAAGARAEEIRVSVAVSLKEAVTEIAKEYKAGRGDEVLLTFGSSGQLATQIKEGAEVDGFISAAEAQVEELAKAGMVVEGSRRVVAGNTLVLIVPAVAKDAPRSIAGLADTRYKRIAIGEPKTVPAGEYAMQVLKAAGLAETVADRLVYGNNVRQVLTYVAGGDVAAGLVYATDAKEAGATVRVVATAAAGTHAAIVYPGVVLKGSKKQEAAGKFLAYLRSEGAVKVLKEKGFVTDVREGAATAPGK